MAEIIKEITLFLTASDTHSMVKQHRTSSPKYWEAGGKGASNGVTIDDLFMTFLLPFLPSLVLGYP